MLRIKDLERFTTAANQPCKIVITTHHKPDGDALGSSLGLYHFLHNAGHQVQVISPTDYPYFLHWMPGNDTVYDFEKKSRESLQAIAAADFIFCLDFNNLSRINDMAEPVRLAKAPKILIDHHLLPQDFEDITFADFKACSTAELIYRFIKHLGRTDEITPAIANCLYAGIMTDTGSFRFDSTTAEVHEIIADLIRHGANGNEVYDRIYNTNKLNRLQFIGYCLSQKLTILPEYNAAYIAITAEELRKYNIGTGDTEGLENYALTIDGIRLAALIIDRTKLIKLSLRSKGAIAVNEICRDYFNGGGHKNASGGSTTKSLEATVQDFLNLLPHYKTVLTK